MKDEKPTKCGRKPKPGEKTKRRFWKVEITPEFAEFERLAASHGLNNAQFFRVLPSLLGAHVSATELRLWMARSLRYLECINQRTADIHGAMSPELQHALGAVLDDIRSVFKSRKRRVKS